MRVAFVYPNPREELARAVAAGEAPDTGLLGQNHLAEYGIAAGIHESRMRRATRQPGLTHRVTWLARELTVPWEVGDATAIVTSLGSLLPLAARVRRGPKTVLININFCTMLDRLRGPRRNLLERSLKAADAIVCLAAAQRAKLLEQITVDPARVHVVLLGVDATYYEPRPEPLEPHVVAVGRDVGRDYTTFAQAVGDLGVRTTIVASARNVAGVGVPSHVEVELDVDPERLRDLYASASCVVVPTRSHEFDHGADCSGQTVLLDAMAMGRPTVITRRSTLAEYVDEGETALLVPAEQPDALGGAIQKLLDRPELRRRLGRQSRESVNRHFTTRHFAAGLAPILEAVA